METRAVGRRRLLRRRGPLGCLCRALGAKMFFWVLCACAAAARAAAQAPKGCPAPRNSSGPASCLNVKAAGCWGCGSNEYWALLQPQHCGTGTSRGFLQQALPVEKCVHSHRNPGTTSVGCGAARLPVILAANPYRRAISHAAWRMVISGVRQTFADRSEADEIAAFRDFVAKRKIRLSPIVVAFAPARDWFVVRTNHLQADFDRLFDRLGFPRRKLPAGGHYVSSRNEKGRNLARDQHAFYDAATERGVFRHFAVDFEFFGFSNSSRDMLL